MVAHLSKTANPERFTAVTSWETGIGLSADCSSEFCPLPLTNILCAPSYNVTHFFSLAHRRTCACQEAHKGDIIGNVSLSAGTVPLHQPMLRFLADTKSMMPSLSIGETPRVRVPHVLLIAASLVIRPTTTMGATDLCSKTSPSDKDRHSL